MVEIEGFPFCCGLSIVGDFESEEEFLEENNLAITDALVGVRGRRAGGVVATTIPSQKHAISSLKKYGFRPLVTFPNARHRSKITLWFRPATLPRKNVRRPGVRRAARAR